MKITKTQLRKIIKEELNKVLNETTPDQLEREGINQEFIQRRDDLRGRFVDYAENFIKEGGCWSFWEPRSKCGRLPPTQKTVDHMDQLIEFKEEFIAFEKWALKNRKLHRTDPDDPGRALLKYIDDPGYKGYPAFKTLMSRKLGKALTPENREAIAARVDDPERFGQLGDWDVEIQREL